MIGNIFFLACAVAAAQAGLVAPVSVYGGAWNPYSGYSSYPAQPAVATQHSNILRSPFNLGQISTYSKSIDTPFSSVRKADIRVSNPGVAVAPAYRTYGGFAAPLSAPLVSHVGVASPFGAPVAKLATAGGLLGVAYSPASAVSHMTYTNGLGFAYGW